MNRLTRIQMALTFESLYAALPESNCTGQAEELGGPRVSSFTGGLR